MNVDNKSGDLRMSELWNEKNAIYARMEELRDMAKKNKDLNLIDEYKVSVSTTEKLMERYRELETDEF